MGSFLSGIFAGNSSGLDAAEGNASNVAGFGTGVGESAVNQGLGFNEALLSGNQAEEARLLAPEISGIQKRGQQQIETAGQFGNRSGGTNAAAQNNIDTQRSNVNDMVSQLTKGAATDVTQTGMGLLNTGLNANAQQAQDAEMKLKNQKDSILGSGIADFSQTALNAAEGAIGF